MSRVRSAYRRMRAVLGEKIPQISSSALSLPLIEDMRGARGEILESRMVYPPQKYLQLFSMMNYTPTASIVDVGGEIYYIVDEPEPTEVDKYFYALFMTRYRGGLMSFEELLHNVLQYVGLREEDVADISAGVYYAWRDLEAYGPITIPMLDDYVEEVGWKGYDEPVMVVDKYASERGVEWIRTNIHATSPDHYRDHIVRLARRSGGELTHLNPRHEGRLPDISHPKLFHRFAGHLSVVGRDSGYTIRKFPRLRFSIPRLISLGSFTPVFASYHVWLLLQRGFIIVLGGMASGKTTLMNSLLASIPPTYKVITVEDTPELDIPTWSHHPLYTRRSHLEEMDIGYEELIQHSLRHRGLVVSVGEVRGREFMDMVQAVFSGHGGITTFHGARVEDLYIRATSPPINASPHILSAVDSVVLVGQTTAYIDGEPMRVRRVLGTYELYSSRIYPSLKKRFGVKGGEESVGEGLISRRLFSWNPEGDVHTPPHGLDIDSILEGIDYLYRNSLVLRSRAGDLVETALAEIFLYSLSFALLTRNRVYSVEEVNKRMNVLYTRMYDILPRALDYIRTIV